MHRNSINVKHFKDVSILYGIAHLYKPRYGIDRLHIQVLYI